MFLPHASDGYGSIYLAGLSPALTSGSQNGRRVLRARNERFLPPVDVTGTYRDLSVAKWRICSVCPRFPPGFPHSVCRRFPPSPLGITAA